MASGCASKDVGELATKLYAEMVDDLVQDLTFLAVQSIKRTRQPCNVCHTYCQIDHATTSSTNKSQLTSQSRPDMSAGVSGHKPPGGVAGTPAKTDIMLNCLNCGRPIASSRYAPHLSNCMGLGNSRRGAVRTSAQKLQQDSEASSPYVESDSGGEESKRKNKLLADVFAPNVKGKKRPMEGKPKPNPKKQKLSPTKVAGVPHLVATTAPTSVPGATQVKGTGPPRRPIVMPLRPASSPVSPPISSTSSGARLLSNPSLSRPSGPTPTPPRLGTSSISFDSGLAPGKGSAINPAPKPHSPSEGGSRLVTHTQSAPVLDTYAPRQPQFPNGDWVQRAAASSYVSPPHADADELVDTDSSDDGD